MKAIELTQQQKDNLLEMAKQLFSESEFSWEYEMYGRALKQDFNDVLAVYDDNTGYFNIHWFEFCIRHLPYHIIKYVYNGDYPTEVLWCDILQSDHPVDYLYKLFKTINK